MSESSSYRTSLSVAAAYIVSKVLMGETLSPFCRHLLVTGMAKMVLWPEKDAFNKGLWNPLSIKYMRIFCLVAMSICDILPSVLHAGMDIHMHLCLPSGLFFFFNDLFWIQCEYKQKYMHCFQPECLCCLDFYVRIYILFSTVFFLFMHTFSRTQVHPEMLWSLLPVNL